MILSNVLLLVQSVCGYFGILTYLEVVRVFGPKVTVIVTSCRKIFTIGLSAALFHHPINGFHVVGVAGVFAGIFWNANAEMRCSRCLAPPALCVMVVVVSIELHIDEQFGGDLQRRACSLIRNIMQTQLF